MEFFKKYFKDRIKPLSNGELAVCCPFPHSSDDGKEYLEENPSAHINPDKDVFHCKVCGASHSEASFLATVQGITYSEAVKFLARLSKSGYAHWSNFVDNLLNSQEKLKTITDMGFSLETIRDLEIGYRGDGFAFPIKVYDEILDVRTYDPQGSPKWKSEAGATALIYPFDKMIQDKRDVILNAGEKDMGITRQMGFNAISFTGGESSFPKLFKYSLKNRRVFIAYDNDFAGKEGAIRVATLLKDAGAIPHIVEGHYQVCANDGEDMHDFFMKYKKTSEDFQKILDNTPEFDEEQYKSEHEKMFPLVSLEESTEGVYSNSVISSRVAVIASFEEIFEVPDVVEFEKTHIEGNKCTVERGWKGTWYLDDSNMEEILRLCDSGLKESDIYSYLKTLVGLPSKEPAIRIKYLSKRPVFKCIVTDDLETEMTKLDEAYQPTEMVVYSFERMNSGGKYRIYYKRFPHPLQAQRIVAIAQDVKHSDSSVNSFKVTPHVIKSLKVFQGETKQKMKELAERAKDICGVETLPQLAWFVDLYYHTPLEFYFAGRKERGYLDMLIVGESRTGKSQTAKKLLDKYRLGVFTSLKTATEAGLIGGSDQTSGGRKTRLGVIPRNHRGAIIMEEFSDGGKKFAKALTDIRSSNIVRLTRVNGTTTVPAMVRMLTISNQPKSSNGQTLPIRQYPNGIKLILDLVGAAEDIARYDLFILVDSPKTYTRPNEQVSLEAYSDESYLNRVRWAWSRKPEQVIIDSKVENYIVHLAEKLNEAYDSHIKFFGAEAWKKLARLAIATAACVASCDDTGEFLIVKTEHVDWARNFMVACYDNKLFKLKEYVEHNRRYTSCTSQAVHAMQGMYNKHATLIQQIEMGTEFSINQLRSISGLTNDEFSEILNRMIECYFILHNGDKLVPSERFRLALSQIDRDVFMRRVGSE